MSKNSFFDVRLGIGVLLVFCLSIALAPSVVAQTAGTGALTGTVTDSTGAVVPNATVTLTSTDTGQVRTATTGPDGVYKFSLLPPGAYRAKFEAAGFKAAEVAAAAVNVTETEVLNGSLQVGAQNQEVSVQADVETIQTASSALGTVVAAQTVTDLPLNTRNYTNLLALSAGANASVTNATYVSKGSYPNPRQWRRLGPEHFPSRRSLHRKLVQSWDRSRRSFDRNVCNSESGHDCGIQNPDGDL